jgi:putative FmdB family regulatory protein
MPIYEYRCEVCGHQEEFLQKVSEPQLTECPVCHKPTFSKLLSAAGFHLKGSGWYATDFKSKSAKPAEKKADAKPDAKTDSTTKTETKSEPKKTESKSEAPA